LNAASDKSIAVLPFENLSADPENGFFTDGVQDEILTDLARIADLKVISRSSVIQYKSGVARNLREIGQQLGVAHVVEGTVQRSGNRVRVNAQLIDARTDKQLWGQVYDRDLSDVFAIQSEIAKTIADQLQAKLSPSEKNAIEQPPTSDITAFDLYTRAKNILAMVGDHTEAELLEAVDLLNQAVARDPSFLDAYCQLAYIHDWFYFQEGLDHTPARLRLAEAAIQAAARLSPNAGETHLARAQHLYWGYFDYDGALAELEIARQTLPNDFRIPKLMAFIQRRQGHWEESTRNLTRAVELNPRDVETWFAIGTNYTYLRRYADIKGATASYLAVFPNELDARLRLEYVEVQAKADTRPLHQMLDSIRATDPAAMPGIARFWLACALAERDATAAKNALDASSENSFTLGYFGEASFSRSFVEGFLARMAKDEGKAQSAFIAAREEQQKIVQAQPNNSEVLGLLGLIDAGLGRKEEALREGRRAVELMENNPLERVKREANLAMIAALVGDKNLACEQLDSIIRRPSPLSYGGLKLFPWWDPLRGDPRFEKLLDEAKLPVVLEQATEAAPDKSIAVLPFQNLSRDPDNAFFADGVQDEILTDLARLADLKVISRTSVTQYKTGIARNLREIAQQLGVANVVEGSVQRAGNRVRVNAQLIDARTDKHLWGQTYDRDLADVFAIQSEIAQAIANELQTKISAGEKAAIEEKPTHDLAAYDFYVRATPLVEWNALSSTQEKDLSTAIDLLNQAVKRDPSFLLAWCQLANAHDAFYFQEIDRTPARLALAQSAIDTAFRLKPNSGEAHLALASHLYYGYFDFDRARAELAIAERTLPNSPDIFALSGFIDRRQSRWSDAIRNMERAAELDPRSILKLSTLAITYYQLHDYEQVDRTVTRIFALDPNRFDARIYRATIDLDRRADTRPLHAELEKILGEDPALAETDDVKIPSFFIALWDRDAAAADRAIAALREKNSFGDDSGQSRDFWKGVLARMKGDTAAAQTAFTAARAEREKRVQAEPDMGVLLSGLGVIDAGLGRKEEALLEGRRAIEITPLAKNALHGAIVLTDFALICAWTGERDLAIQQLVALAKIPQGPTYGDLRLNPMWDPLRGDPRFEKLVEDAKQSVTLK
jgi:TolB-like protein/Tfp pilus assembly protein PilF